eukprot:5511186-Amphidinium_carterae.3
MSVDTMQACEGQNVQIEKEGCVQRHCSQLCIPCCVRTYWTYVGTTCAEESCELVCVDPDV